MRAIAAAVLVMGCAGASATPLSPQVPVSDAQPAQRNKVRHASELAPSEATAAEPSSNASPPAATPALAPRQSTRAPDKGASTVQLLSAGAEPRQLLRYVFHRGESANFRERTDMHREKVTLEMTTSVVGAPSSVVKKGITVDVGETTSNGTAHLELTLDPMTNQSKASMHTTSESTTSGAQVQIKIDTETEYRSGP